MVASTKKVCFVVTGEFMTQHCRSLFWDEESPDKAMDTLSCCEGITEQQILDVLFGRAKLIGDSSVGIDLVKDNAKVSPHGNKMSKNLVEFIKKMAKKQRDAEDDVYDLTHERVSSPSPLGLVDLGVRQNKRLKEKKSVDEYGKAFEDECRNRIPPRKVFRDGIDGLGSRPKVKNFWDGSDGKKEAPVPDENLNSINGWIATDGKFYPCEYTGHNELAEDLGFTPKSIEEAGYVKISSSFTDCHVLNYEGKRPTEQQRDTIAAWCEKHKEKVPAWAKEFPDMEDDDV